MDHESYVVIKNAGMYNIVDSKGLEKAKMKVVPTIREKIDRFLNNFSIYDIDSGLDLHRFTDQFLVTNSPKDRLDEIVVTFLLFLANQLSQQKIIRSFHAYGAWESEYAWNMLFKWVIFSIFTLVYDVRGWTSEYYIHLENAIIDIAFKGDASALSRFAEKIGVQFESETSYPAEQHFTKFEYHNPMIFGPYYWRMLHFMAEAMVIRKDANDNDVKTAKKLWKQYLTETMYRTLQCNLCKLHYKDLLDHNGYKEKIMNCEDEDFPKLWYEIHNKVNYWKNNYSEDDWKKDREFMKLALISPTTIR